MVLTKVVKPVRNVSYLTVLLIKERFLPNSQRITHVFLKPVKPVKQCYLPFSKPAIGTH